MTNIYVTMITIDEHIKWILSFNKSNKNHWIKGIWLQTFQFVSLQSYFNWIWYAKLFFLKFNWNDNTVVAVTRYFMIGRTPNLLLFQYTRSLLQQGLEYGFTGTWCLNQSHPFLFRFYCTTSCDCYSFVDVPITYIQTIQRPNWLHTMGLLMH